MIPETSYPVTLGVNLRIHWVKDFDFAFDSPTPTRMQSEAA
jgi:hypothetical protein